MGRDVKRVHEDVNALTELGLFERTPGSGVVCPYSDIHVDAHPPNCLINPLQRRGPLSTRKAIDNPTPWSEQMMKSLMDVKHCFRYAVHSPCSYC